MAAMILSGRLSRDIVRGGCRVIGARCVAQSNKANVKLLLMTRHSQQLQTVNKIGSCHAFRLCRKGYRSFHTGAILHEEYVIKCPSFAESITEGDMIWSKAVGDFVEANEAVGEIETAKTSIPVLAPQSGVITELLVEDGATVTPGTELVKLDTKGEKVAESEPAEKRPDAPAPPPPISEPPPPPPSAAGAIPDSLPPVPPIPAAPISSTPVSDIKPQRIVTPQTPPTTVTTRPLKPGQAPKTITGTRTESRMKMTRMRLAIADRLKEAQNTCAMLTTFNEVDMSNILEMRKQYKDEFMKKFNIKLGFMSAFVKASAYALQDQPIVNAVIEGNEIVYRDYCDISVAVATPKGLVVPVIRGCESMNYADIELYIGELGEKARKGELEIEDMEGGTFSISNGGVFRGLFGTPIINPPQSAILGMYGVFDRPVAVQGKVEIRPMMYVALTYDHRLIDGREAVFFLRKIKACVEDPRTLLLNL